MLDIQSLLALEVKTLDHHGIVAATIKRLGIAEKINELIGSKDPRRKVQPGEAVAAMIINGLGFTNRRLYLLHQFFHNKPIDLLLNKDLQASDLNDQTLGNALDEIAEYGATEFFTSLAFKIGEEQDLLSDTVYIDSTSFYMHTNPDIEDPTTSVLEVIHGHSKDHRPDLPQVMLFLAMTTKGFPLFAQAANGNTSDQKHFDKVIKNIKSFQKQLRQSSTKQTYIADSCLYNKERLLASTVDYDWLTRVPETNTEAKNLINLPTSELRLQSSVLPGYSYQAFDSHYGDCKQRWLLVRSEQAYQKECKTYEKRLEKDKASAEKKIKELERKSFYCLKDAQEAITELQSKTLAFNIIYTIKETKTYESPGRPKVYVPELTVSYLIFRVKAELQENQEYTHHQREIKGRFLLATNNLDVKRLGNEQMLMEYKGLAKIERGFRFLKDPWFMVDSFFLKDRGRIAALMMVMTLTLMVYNYAERFIRNALKESGEKIPNQINKPIQNPTLRWIFQIMEGIQVSLVPMSEGYQKHIVWNLTPIRKKIIHLFGDQTRKIYCLNTS
jgi:transposase